MDAPSAEAAGSQPNPPPPPPPPTTTTDTANAAGGDATATLAFPPPLLTGTAGSSAAQSQPQQATELNGDEPLPPLTATGAEEVAGKPRPPTTPASTSPAPPEPLRATEAKGGEPPPPPPATGAEAVAGKPQPPTTPARKPPAPPEPPRGTEGDEPPPASTGEKEEVAFHGQPPPPTTPERKPPAPPEPTQQQQAGDAAKQVPSAHEEEDGGKKKHSGWHFLRKLFRHHKGSLRDAVKAAAGGAGADGAVTKPQEEEEEEEEGKGEGNKKSGPDEAKPPPRLTEKIKSLVPDSSYLRGGAVAEEGGRTPGSTPPAEAEAEAPPPAPDDDEVSRRHPPRKRLMKVLWAVRFIITCLKNSSKTGGKEDQKPEPEKKEERPSETEKEEKPPEPEQAKEKPTSQLEEEEKTKEKPAAQQLEEEEKKKKKEAKSRRRWEKIEEERLQEILEVAFTKLLASEFDKLKDPLRKCLLTFSFFPVNHKVKKQAVTYWWAAQFDLPHRRPPGDETEPRGAEEIFGDLCGSGFLEPIKNRCSGVSHGCRVNPLVHWMVKRTARDFAGLDALGDPADEQGESTVFCLTARHRERLQKLDRPDESPSPTKKTSPTRKSSKGQNPSPARMPSRQDPQQKDRSPARTPSKEGRQQMEPSPTGTPSKMVLSKLQGEPKEQQNENDKTNLELKLKKFANVRVIINLNAHVYRLPDCLLSYLGDHLVVLQLGRWWNSDNSTYMEVEGLEKLSAIGNLKKLRYLGIRGLSKLTELPKEVNKLQQLEVLDVRGCQNLTRVMSSTVKNLRRLTHLDLTECYMLEHIGWEITSLSELQVFKGFVFGVDAPWNNIFQWFDRKVCHLQDLGPKMKNLRKLSINVTTDANVDKNEMAQLKHLESLQSLTITWGELPIILTSEKRGEEKRQLLQRWTSLVLPPKLEKLDVRCYPGQDIPLNQWLEPKRATNLKKLYVRGGAVEELKLPKDNNIKTLRLRYLKEFKMKWTEIFQKMKNLCYVEVVYKDAKVMMSEKIKCQTGNVELQPHVVKQAEKEEEEKCMAKIKEIMCIPESTLDEDGVWEFDEKEDDENKMKEGFEGDKNGSKDAPESTKPPSKVAEKDDHDTEATRDDDVTEVSSDSNMMGKGAQAPSGQQSKNDNLKTGAITNQDVGILKDSHNVENARTGDVQAPYIEPPKNNTPETEVVANHDTLSAPKVLLKKEQKEKQLGGPKVLLASNEGSIMENSKSGNPNEQSSRVNNAFDTSGELHCAEGKVSDTLGEQHLE